MDLLSTLAMHYPDVQVTCIGDSSVYANFTHEAGGPLPSEEELQSHFLEDLKAEQIDELSKACQAEIRRGFTSSALGALAVYDSAEVDQLNLIGTVAATAPTPTAPSGYSVPYAVRKIADGVIQPKTYEVHSYGQFRMVLTDGVTYKLTRLLKFNDKRAYLLNNVALTPEDIEAVTWESVEPAPPPAAAPAPTP